MSNKTKQEFDALLGFTGYDDRIEHDATILSLRFISELNQLMEERGINKTTLANALNVSAAYITKVFKGDKLVNMEFLAKVQEYFNIAFCIEAIDDREKWYLPGNPKGYTKIDPAYNNAGDSNYAMAA